MNYDQKYKRGRGERNHWRENTKGNKNLQQNKKIYRSINTPDNKDKYTHTHTHTHTHIQQY